MSMGIGAYGGSLRRIVADGDEDDESAAASEEMMLLWAFQQPTLLRHNAFVSHSSLEVRFDACGSSLLFHQSPCSLIIPGLTGSVVWDSGIVLAKFLEYSVDSGNLLLKGKRVIELGSGCGVVGCVAALLGARVTLTDLPDRLKLLRKNVEYNLEKESRHGDLATVSELTWGDELIPEFVDPPPDYVIGSDVIYDEGATEDLLETLTELCDGRTTVILSAELRNDIILEYFIEKAMKSFTIGRVEQTEWHPEYRSNRIVLYILAKKSD